MLLEQGLLDPRQARGTGQSLPQPQTRPRKGERGKSPPLHRDHGTQPPVLMSIIPRKVYEPAGFAHTFTDGKCKPLPSNVAYLKRNNRNELIQVTWDEVMAARREYQKERLERIERNTEPTICPCYVWTFFNKQDIPYHGWYCYIISRYFEIGVNFRGFENDRRNVDCCFRSVRLQSTNQGRFDKALPLSRLPR